MPLDEEGAKWSCEPCIRGHRSSKCQHFDRLMMKVPKAGRPLAKCPHPKGTCSCQKTYAVMVRIPKGSSCLCRPLYKVPADPNDSSQSTPGPISQVSSPSPAKVQKSGRRQSTIQAAPENIVKALESMPEDVKLEDNMVNYLANLPVHQPSSNGTYSGIDQSHIYSTASTPKGLSRDIQPAQGSSCCSQKPKAPPTTPPQATPPRSGEKSCCAGKTTTPEHPSNATESNDKQNTWNAMAFMDFPNSQASSWQTPMAPNQGPFMPSYGMPDSQLQSIYMNDYAHNIPSPYSNTMRGVEDTKFHGASYTPHGSQMQTHTPTTVGGEACHDCKCGDECQCLGCAAHPFNNTTRQHVQEMGVMMTFDGDEHTPEAIAKAYQAPPSYHGSSAPTPLNFYMQQAPSMDQGAHQNSFGPYPDPHAAMANGYSSPLDGRLHMNQQLMHPSEYYTLEYPVGIPSACSDVTGSCQCGNDCSCVGCLTHSGHNGLALEAPVSNPGIANTTTPAQVPSHYGPPHHGPHVTSATPHSSRIPVLENVSVSCLSPRTLETSMI